MSETPVEIVTNADRVEKLEAEVAGLKNEVETWREDFETLHADVVTVCEDVDTLIELVADCRARVYAKCYNFKARQRMEFFQ